ncbi:MAG TPA: response regulator [Deltaproteobacteria bacterium]|nr:response regulator [Deltaproteobacteria bacterium]HPP79567.1 response regulator [Deltaproteobacteria bacterium]
MEGKVVFLDDDEHILRAIRRLFADTGLDVTVLDDPWAALDLVAGGGVAVVVSDNRMPAMEGTEFLARVRSMSPDTVRIMLTGYADLATAMDAINRCGVYKFIEKPWRNAELVGVVKESLERHRIVTVMRDSDEPALLSLASAIELKDPYTKGHCDSVAGYAVAVGKAIGMPENEVRQMKYGCWLHDCGKIGVPEAILNKPGPLTEEEFEIVRKHPEWGAELARQARLSEIVVNVIACHHERFDGTGYPRGLKAGAIPIHARIACIADVFDALTSDRSYRARHSHVEAVGMLYSMKGSFFDPELAEVFLTLVAEEVAGEKTAGDQDGE